MICPECKAEYIDGISVCADCGTELIPVEDFVDEEDEIVSLEDWQVVHTTGDIIEAEMYKANLSGAGIESVIFSKEDRMRLNLSFVGSAPIKIFVKKDNLEDASQIITEIKNSQLKDEDLDGKADE